MLTSISILQTKCSNMTKMMANRRDVVQVQFEKHHKCQNYLISQKGLHQCIQSIQNYQENAQTINLTKHDENGR